MSYSFTRKTDNFNKVMAVDVNELQIAVEAISATVDTMSSINATFLLSAAGITPAVTNGCADPEKKTSSSNLVTYKIAAFDASTVEIGWFNHPLPSDYDGGTILYRVYWEHPATTTNFKVAFNLAAVAIADDGAIDTAVGSTVQVNDTGGTTNDLYITPWSTALTIAGTPTYNKMVYWRLQRVANDATNDTLAVDAWVKYVEITYTRA
jgi:hypothetical protein